MSLSHWARLIELLHSAEDIKELLLDKDLQGTKLVKSGRRARRASPSSNRAHALPPLPGQRNRPDHHRQPDRSTTNNNEPMNRAVKGRQKTSLASEITEGMLDRVEVAIRASNPCLSCATTPWHDLASRGHPLG